MSPAINVLVTCTKRKTLPVPRSLQLGTVPPGPIETRARTWLGRLRSRRHELSAADALYAGDSWNVVRSLATGGAGRLPPLRIWICSAGYGLVSLTSRISPYSATFDPSEPDSVTSTESDLPPREVPRAWWRLIANWEGPDKNAPRTIQELAEGHPRSPLLVVASAVYLNALADDLREGLARLSDPDQLSIISAGSSSFEDLSQHLLPCDARLQPMVGGARQALNARLARFALLSLGGKSGTYSALCQVFSPLLASCAKCTTKQRPSLTDAQVKNYIRNRLKPMPSSRPTPVLKALREKGYACEQSRFASLFREVREELNGA